MQVQQVYTNRTRDRHEMACVSRQSRFVTCPRSCLVTNKPRVKYNRIDGIDPRRTVEAASIYFT